MTCTRCQGLLLPTRLYDRRSAPSVRRWGLAAMRCAICGDIVERKILEHRLLSRARHSLEVPA